MPTNPNMVAIQTVTVGAGGSSSISFTSIPQTYTDLQIILSARTDGASPPGYATLRFNGNSSAIYSRKTLQGDGNTAQSYPATGETAVNYIYVNGNAGTASTFSNTSIYIPNYNSSNNKALYFETVQEYNATTNAWIMLQGNLWENTSAITSITLEPQNVDAQTKFLEHSTATLYGITSAGSGAKATGGVITSDTNYYYHTFTASGTFTPTQNLSADYLVVAGGGAGGGDNPGGGGGAGGLRCTVTATGGGGSLESALSLTSGTSYTVTVGAGGAAASSGAQTGNNGSNSVFSTITSTGGGGGAHVVGGAQVRNGANGGSGGGATSYNSTAGTGGTGISGQGFAGGSATSNSSGYTAAGGGGAGSAASSVSGSDVGSNGGNGITTSISGTSTTYAGGGGAGRFPGSPAGSGGSGGGGAGFAGNGTGNAGTSNTGGGGGGGGTGGNGGSGVVIIRYAK